MHPAECGAQREGCTRSLGYIPAILPSALPDPTHTPLRDPTLMHFTHLQETFLASFHPIQSLHESAAASRGWR